MNFEGRYSRFQSDFERLQKNRKAIPIAELETKYAAQYSSLVAAVTAGADWFARAYIGELVGDFPSSGDAAQDGVLRASVAFLLEEDRRPGGLREKALEALVGRLDRLGFEDVLYQRYSRIEQKAFLPWFRQYCEPYGENGWTYCRLIDAYWKKTRARPEGAWVRKDGDLYRYGWPPID